MAQFPVKWFTLDMGDSPKLGDTASGDFIALLKACLIHGFNPKTPGSVSYEPSAGVITVVLGADHGFLNHQIVEISGAVESDYNGEFRVVAVGADWIQLAVAAAPSTSSASGASLEIRTAPIGGWQVVAEDVENYTIALKRTALDATDYIFLIDNSYYSGDYSVNGNFARVHVCESFTDFATYEEAFMVYWPASHRYSAHEWMLIGDTHMFYWINRYAYSDKRGGFVLGDIETVRPGDVSHCLSIGIDTGGSAEWDRNEYSYSNLADLGSTEYRNIARAYHQLPGSTSWSMVGVDGGFGASFNYPNPQTNGFYVSTGRLMVKESGGLRGFMPGVVQPLQTNGNYHKAILDNIPGFEGIPVLFWFAQQGRYYSNAERLMAWRLDRWRPEVG